MIILGSFKENSEHAIAETILKKYCCNEKMTGTLVSQEAGVSPNSITHFCRQLGYPSFAAFKDALFSRGEVRKDQLKNHIQKSTEEQILRNIMSLSGNTADINDFKKKVQKINQLIKQDKRIIIIGAGYPEALALHYAEDMIAMNIFTSIYPVAGDLELEFSKNDVFIMFISITGRLAEFFKKQYDNICTQFSHICFIGNLNSKTHNDKVLYLPVPIDGDDETGNILLVEMLRYMKFDYYWTYKDGES